MKPAFVFFWLLTTVLLFGCKRASVDSLPAGAYAYTSYDSSGTALVRGWFTLVISDSTSISGEWHMEPIGDPQKIGPQSGDGNLVGGLNGTKVWIELNSKVTNNNLQLNGTLTPSELAGQWAWISFDGIGNQGTFKAIKK